MSAFGGLFITNKGRALQAKSQAGIQLNFTRIGIGDGSLSGQSISDLNALISEKKSLSITKCKVQSVTNAVVGAVLSNQDMATGFYFREIGVFAQDPDVGEILYCYGNAGANAEYIPAGGGSDIVEKNVDVLTIIGNATSVTATIDSSLVYASASDLQAHIDDTNNPHQVTAEQVGALPSTADAATDVIIGNRTADPTQAPSGLVGTLTQWFSWLTNRIKAITGTVNWYDAPPTTLTAANSHMTNTNNPHNVTAAQVGAVATTAVGQANGVAPLGADGQIASQYLGHVPPVNAATSSALGTVELPASAGSPATPVAVYRANSIKEYLLADTNLDNVLTFTPAAAGNFLVAVSVRVVTANTNVTIQITWTDASGNVQTDTRCSNANLGVGPHDVPVKFINANASQITVKVQAGIANQVYASATIVGV